MFFFFFKQKTAYELRISDWSSDVCSSDLRRARRIRAMHARHGHRALARLAVVDGDDAAAVDAPRHVVLVLAGGDAGVRSEERRVGKECVRTCSSRWSPYN